MANKIKAIIFFTIVLLVVLGGIYIFNISTKSPIRTYKRTKEVVVIRQNDIDKYLSYVPLEVYTNNYDTSNNINKDYLIKSILKDLDSLRNKEKLIDDYFYGNENYYDELNQVKHDTCNYGGPCYVVSNIIERVKQVYNVDISDYINSSDELRLTNDNDCSHYFLSANKKYLISTKSTCRNNSTTKKVNKNEYTLENNTLTIIEHKVALVEENDCYVKVTSGGKTLREFNEIEVCKNGSRTEDWTEVNNYINSENSFVSYKHIFTKNEYGYYWVSSEII